ncbi:Poly-glutamine tract binding protein 1 [Strongyloides ratti]|uniref:Poly-glutamine tract binding protein 1 n=1 Tax=Strongyloides ratti TaxID=34506 RepID=A0A090N0U3_STRRB|nr:Poly-glutamine tract binding protein 1 [Strongyloides ratti]CEF71288.1 Poly-glutamine tract binding protein 1 [Strongyloides ratti]
MKICENLYLKRQIHIFVEGSVNTTAYVGDTVILKCHVENQEGTVQWLLEGLGLRTERDLPMFSQFRMVGSPMKGEYDLEITMLQDGMMVFMNVNHGKKHKNGDLIFAKEGVPIEEICFLSKTHPTPKFYWVITKSGTLDNILSWIGNGIPDVTIDSDNDTLKQINKIKLLCNVNSKPEHSGSNFTIKNVQKWQTGEYECVATNNDFKPVILSHNLFIEGDFQVRANDTVFVNHESIATLSCEFHGYPKPGDIIWTFNGENIITGKPSKRFNVIQIDKNFGVDSKLIIYNLESKDISNYNCTASTIYTTVTATISLRSYTIIKKKTIYRLRNKKYVSDIQVECPAVDDINFVSVELLRKERTNSFGASTYNKAYNSIS